MQEKYDLKPENLFFNTVLIFFTRHWKLISVTIATCMLIGLGIGLSLGLLVALPFLGLATAVPVFVGIGLIIGGLLGVLIAIGQDWFNKPMLESNLGLNKNSPLETLQHDIFQEIGHQSTTKDLSSLSRTSNSFYNLFKHNVLVRQLLEAVVHGNQNTAERILKMHPQLMTVKGQVTDYSGRVFFSVSAFEYALWALDTRYMTGMMLTCLKENSDLTIDGKSGLAKTLQQQYDQMQTQGRGISYILKGVQHSNEKHFDITPLLTALQTYINGLVEYRNQTRSDDSIKALFIKGVGLQQWLLPAHMAQHYCESSLSFSYLPKTKVFKRILDVYNWVNQTDQQWWAKDNLVLGDDFGVFRPSGLEALGQGDVRGGSHRVKSDLSALKALFEIRIRDCSSINDELDALIQNNGFASGFSCQMM